MSQPKISEIAQGFRESEEEIDPDATIIPQLEKHGTVFFDDNLQPIEESEQQEEEQLKDENEERNNLKINIDELKYIVLLGKGGFGTVQLVMDETTKKQYAKKQFSTKPDYIDEIKLVYQLEKEFGKKLPDITCTLEFCNMQKQIVLYEAGVCSLWDLATTRVFYNVFWWNKQQELVHILKKLIQLFKALHEKNLMHSDLKPQNIVLYNSSISSNDIFDVKLIDFGAATFDFKQLKAFTTDFFVPDAESLKIQTREERIKYEFYTLGRTMQKIMLTSLCKEEGLEMSEVFQNTPEAIQDSIELLKKHYSEDLVSIVNDLLKMDVLLGQIEEKLEKLKGEPIRDSEMLIGKLVYDKMVNEISKKKQSKIDEQMAEYCRMGLHDKVVQVFNKLDDEKYNSKKLLSQYFLALYSLGDFGTLRDVVENVEKNYEKQKDPQLNEEYMFYVFTKIKGHGYGDGLQIMNTIKPDIITKYGEDSIELGFFYYYLCEFQVFWQKHYEVPTTFGLCEKQLKFLEKYPEYKATLTRFLGLTKFRQGSYQEAIKFYEQEKLIREAVNQTSTADYGLVLQNIGVSQMQLGQYDSATTNYQEASEIVRKTKGMLNIDYQNILHNIGANYFHLNNIPLALQFLEQCLCSRVQYKNFSLEFMDQDSINNIDWLVYIYGDKFKTHYEQNIRNLYLQYIDQQNYHYAKIYLIIAEKLVNWTQRSNGLDSEDIKFFNSEINFLRKLVETQLRAQNEVNYSKSLNIYEQIDNNVTTAIDDIKKQEYFAKMQLQLLNKQLWILTLQKQYQVAYEKLEFFQMHNQITDPVDSYNINIKKLNFLMKLDKNVEALNLAYLIKKMVEANKLDNQANTVNKLLIQLLGQARKECLEKQKVREAMGFLAEELTYNGLLHGKLSKQYISFQYLVGKQFELIFDYNLAYAYYNQLIQNVAEMKKLNKVDDEMIKYSEEAQEQLIVLQQKKKEKLLKKMKELQQK